MIRKIVVPLAFAAVLVSSLAAMAESMLATDVIKTIDAAKNEIVLNDGKTYQLPAEFKADSIQVGQKVTVTFDVTDGKNVATKVEVAQ